MKKNLIARQSQFSVALMCYFGFGMVFLVLSITVFSVKNPMPIALVLTFAGLCAVIVLAALIFGRNFSRHLGIALVALGGIVILASALFTPTDARAMNLGLFLYANLIMLVWFGPMLFARLFGYSWLLIYWVIMEMRFAGEIFPFLVTLTMTAVTLGELIHAFKKKLDAQSFTDPLTGVWNRRTFESSLDIAIAVAGRTNRPLTLLYLDLDNFKAINDEEGHSEGDRVLCEFSLGIKERVRPGDSFARIGGDEFVLILRDTTAEEARKLAERLLTEVHFVSWSYGVAEYTPDESRDTFIARADTRMLEEKQSRRA